MPDRDVRTIRELIHHQYAKIVAQSAFVASDGESRLDHRGDKKCHDSIPPLLHPICRGRNCSGRLGTGDMDGDNVITVLGIDAVI